jgi:hypothetical protein
MRRALLALCAICGALAWPAAAVAGGAITIKDVDIGVSILADRYDPCTAQNDLVVTFGGISTLHATEKVQDGVVISARVDFSQVGLIATTIGGVDYVGGLSYSSKVNLNNQNQNASVQLSVAAYSADLSSSIVFNVDERVAFNASDPLIPASGSTRISVASCPS